MSRAEDIRMLREVLDAAVDFDDDRAESFQSTSKAFADMLSRLQDGGRDLTDKQRAWLRGVHENVVGEVHYENAWSAGKVPRGREVETPEVLKHLPLRPPTRKAEP